MALAAGLFLSARVGRRCRGDVLVSLPVNEAIKSLLFLVKRRPRRVVLLTELQLGLGCFVIDGTELLTKTAADDEEPKWRTCQAWPSTLRQVTGPFWCWSAWLRWPFLTELTWWYTWSPLIDSASIPATNCTGFSELLIERRHLEAILACSVAVDWCRLTV